VRRELALQKIPKVVPIPKKRAPRKKNIMKNENEKDKKARKKIHCVVKVKITKNNPKKKKNKKT